MLTIRMNMKTTTITMTVLNISGDNHEGKTKLAVKKISCDSYVAFIAAPRVVSAFPVKKFSS